MKKEDRIQMICTDIGVSIEKEQLDQVCFASSCDEYDTEKIMETCGELLQSKIENISYAKSVVSSSESLEKLGYSDGVVLFERVDVSLYKDIERELDYCKRYQIPIIGCVVIE